MRYRTLPRSGVELSEICYGSMRFVPPNSGPDQWDEGERALHAAIEGGVNVIHSSSEYKTYEATGAVLSRHPKRSELHHIIKVQSPNYEEGAFSASDFRAQIEQAMRHLHTDHIAVVQHLQRGPNCPKDIAYTEEGDKLRIPAINDVVGPLMESAAELKEEGKIGELACFPHTMGFARAALDAADFDGFVHFFNLVETEMAELFPTFAERDMAFIAIRPIQQGMLTDKRADRDSLPAEDPKRAAKWDRWYALLDEVRAVLPEQPSSWTDYAMKFSLAHPAVNTVVVGLNTPEQVQRCLAITEGDYPSVEVVDAVAETTRRVGPVAKTTLL